jgi:hypothetical protein
VKAVKWDEATKTYSAPFDVDMCSLLSEDFDRLVECPSCHKKHKWGEMINCGEYYTVGGIWKIPVCPECAQKIWDAERKKNG